MADILIRMNMPNSCVECSSTGLSVAASILGASCPWCREVIDAKVNLRIARHADCPLVELPEHGNLISLKDAKTVIDRFLGYLDEEMIYRIKYKLNQDCTVIVPSNKGETE